ncbi:hypothetical protein FACS189447_01930 [Spirochaetia bacterium]|nr:hypothetical protein FACS189447_01930 [Spirochaetia bacterium]
MFFRMKKIVLLMTGIFIFFSFSLSARSFDDIFPNIGIDKKNEAFTEEGIIRSLDKGEIFILNPAPASGIDLQARIMQKAHEYLTESILVVPYSGRTLGVLDAYNSLGKVRLLKGRLYHSFTRNANIPLFEEATRIESAKRTNTAIPDPAPVSAIPANESIYIKLKDVNFGNSYYRADISQNGYGLVYNLTNFKSLTYLLFTVMKEEKFSAFLYLEPLDEGMLVYAVAGTEVSDFIANRIDIPSAISKRLAVFIDWIREGIQEQR